MKTIDADVILARATPAVHQKGHEIQPFNHSSRCPLHWLMQRVQSPSRT
jgi:hypothetical protein